MGECDLSEMRKLANTVTYWGDHPSKDILYLLNRLEAAERTAKNAYVGGRIQALSWMKDMLQSMIRDIDVAIEHHNKKEESNEKG